MTVFGLKAKDSGHFADVLAAASSNANTNVSMMGETFKYCAPIAGSLGFSVEDTAVAGGGSVCSADLNSLVGVIKEAVGGISGNNEDIVIPVYLGGTMLDVVRSGVVNIAVTFQVTQKWLKLLTGFKQQEKISVDYFDTETADMKKTEMYVEGFRSSLEKDTSYKGLWTVSFSVREL